MPKKEEIYKNGWQCVCSGNGLKVDDRTYNPVLETEVCPNCGRTWQQSFKEMEELGAKPISLSY